jgi:hypothetical protein
VVWDCPQVCHFSLGVGDPCPPYPCPRHHESGSYRSWLQGFALISGPFCGGRTKPSNTQVMRRDLTAGTLSRFVGGFELGLRSGAVRHSEKSTKKANTTVHFKAS